MKTQAGVKVANQLMGSRVLLSERCCGESGTLSVARPDISTQVRFRKLEEIEKGLSHLQQGKSQESSSKSCAKILTSCPSCLQGLSRFRDDTPVQAEFMVVEMARRLLGEDWMAAYLEKIEAGGVDRVLL